MRKKRFDNCDNSWPAANSCSRGKVGYKSAGRLHRRAACCRDSDPKSIDFLRSCRPAVKCVNQSSRRQFCLSFSVTPLGPHILHAVFGRTGHLTCYIWDDWGKPFAWRLGVRFVDDFQTRRPESTFTDFYRQVTVQTRRWPNGLWTQFAVRTGSYP